MNTFLAKSKTTDKTCFLVGDLNLNLIDYQSNAKVRDFLNLIFQHALVPIENKPTRVTKNNATLINYIITNSFMDQENLTGILKTDISDHFPILTISVKYRLDSSDKKVAIRKRIINADSIQEFRDILSEVDRGNLYSISNLNDAYEYFLKDLAFRLKTFSVKRKTLQNRWMTKGFLKLSKRKQKLYERFVKKRSPRNENIYKPYKSLFESLKKKSKKNCYTRRLENYQNDIKKSWDVIKEIIGGTKSTKGIFPKRMIIDDQEISDQGKIANCSNKFFVDIGPKLASMIPELQTQFDQYLNPHQTFMGEANLTDDELKEALRSLKPNKSRGYDNISSNVVNETSDIFFTHLKYIFNLSLQQGVFPENLKLTKVSPVYKKDEEFLLTNYRPISVLPCFSKLLERIMYNRLFKYLSENSILYKKQFGFQTSHRTEHAILLLINQLYQSFDESKFTLGIFNDLSKAFDTVDHKILTKKLELCGIKDCNLRWFESYLSNREQFITYGDKQTYIETITCEVPQGSILGPLLFLVFVNDFIK